MRFNSLSILLSAASAAWAGVIPRDDSGYTWSVTQWQAGLSQGNPVTPTTSFYTFTISGPASGLPGSATYIPPFGAHCTGSGAGFPLSSAFSECAMNSTVPAGSTVSARIVPNNGTQAHIAINYAFQTAHGTRDFTATAVTDWARERPPFDFTLTPSEK
ncbi:hypothetical protein GGS21DRAFT_312878 [Xylaria nigripes]|nr:hypothetical protein GGS21DRAFT_312878 [Xylaria nigripes]